MIQFVGRERRFFIGGRTSDVSGRATVSPSPSDRPSQKPLAIRAANDTTTRGLPSVGSRSTRPRHGQTIDELCLRRRATCEPRRATATKNRHDISSTRVPSSKYYARAFVSGRRVSFFITFLGSFRPFLRSSPSRYIYINIRVHVSVSCADRRNAV